MSEPATNGLPGSAERALPGPIHHNGPGPTASGWVDPRHRGLGGRGLALHRLTGLVIVLYLYLHLAVLSMLLVGRSSWSSFLSLVTAKSFLVLEAVLIAAVAFHGLNGLRVALVGSGIAVSRERVLLWAAGGLAGVAGLFALLHILGVL
jgi:succinate dehydrogenase / fumarate reductase, cytochrome b subunit